MKYFWVLVINLILLVKISQSHTIPPTIIAKSESYDDDDGLQVNQDDNTISEVFEPDTNDVEPSEQVIEPNYIAESSKEDELVFAHVVSDFNRTFREEENRVDFSLFNQFPFTDVSPWRT